MKVFINLIGTLFMRTVERADRIYQAMLSRGFSGTIYYVKSDRLRKADFVCLPVTGVFLILFRTVDLVNIIGRQAERMF
jgi:cobalt/nickel transport system permease protein